MEIRHLKTEELPELQTFIDRFWKKDHILSKNKELMDFQHYDSENDRYNWIIAKDDEGIQVILGFIMTSHFDPNITRKDVWLAIWKKSEKELPRGTGTKLLDYLEDYYKPDSVAAIGINDNIEKLYHKRGWASGMLNHFVFVNPGRIATYPETDVFIEGIRSGFQKCPEKSLNYVWNRYVYHPTYKYKRFIMNGMTIITRRIELNGGACLRIVDCFGEMSGSQYAFHELCKQEQVDYIDMLSSSLHVPEGLVLKDDIVLPNWFEPFEQVDKPIKYAYKSDNMYFIYKGDSDQDRPSQ